MIVRPEPSEPSSHAPESGSIDANHHGHMDSLRGHMRRGIAWTAAQHWGVQLIRMAVLLFLARWVTPTAFGIFALASTTVGIMQLFTGQGMTAAVTQRKDLEDRHTGAAFAAMLVASMVMAAVLILAAPIVGRLMAQPRMVPLLRALAVCLPLNAVSGMPIALWRRHLKFSEVALVTTASQLIASVAAIVLAVKGFDLWCLAARQIGEAILMLVFTMLATPWRTLARSSWQAYREMIHFAGPIAAVNLLALGRNRLDELIVGSILGAEALGYYALARRQIEGVAQLVPAVIGNALAPVIARVQHDPARVKVILVRGLGLLGALTLPVFVGMGGAASIWVPLLLGRKWQPAVPILMAFAIVAATRAIVGFNLAALLATGHSWRRLLVESVSTIMALAFILAAVPWGVLTVAWVSALAMLVISPFELLWIARWTSFSLREQARALRGPVAGSAAFALVLAGLHTRWITHRSLTLQLAVAVAAGTTALVLCVYKLPRLPNEVPAAQPQ